MDRALQYLALAHKGNRAALGEESVASAARAGDAWLICVAADAADRTWRRAESLVQGTRQQVLRLELPKDRMGAAVGRTDLALAAFTDPELALAFVRALPEPPETVAAPLEAAAERARKLRKEAQAHRRNQRHGRQKKDH